MRLEELVEIFSENMHGIKDIDFESKEGKYQIIIISGSRKLKVDIEIGEE